MTRLEGTDYRVLVLPKLNKITKDDHTKVGSNGVTV